MPHREPLVHQSDLDSLARALYETAPGTNGYRPLHESIPWERLGGKEWWRDRAREVASKMRENSS